MPNELLKVLAKGEGFCCPRMMLQDYAIVGQNNLSLELAEKVADKIGVTSRTVYNWNRRIREGDIDCTQKYLCPNRHQLNLPN